MVMKLDLKIDKFKMIICMICVIVLIFAVIYKSDDLRATFLHEEKETTEDDAIKFKKEYEELNDTKNPSGKTYPKVEISESNPVKYSNAKEIIKVLDSGTGIIYLGYPKCPWCRNAVPILMQAASDLGIEKVYYMNMYDERDEYGVEDGELVLKKSGTDQYKQLLKALDEVLDDYVVEDEDGKEYETGEKRIYVPYVIFVRDGEIVGIHDDTVESQKDPYVALTEKQKEELYDIYTDYIHKVLDDICDERC